MNIPNTKVIFVVTLTICLGAIVGIIVESMCVVYKVPDMNTTMSGSFSHTVDTLIGALIAMLINTRTQPNGGTGITTTTVTTTPPTANNKPAAVVIHQPTNEPIPVVTQPQT